VKPHRFGIFVTALLAPLMAASVAFAQTPKKPPAVINPPPTAQDWADIGKLPDWSGVWNPKISDQDAQVKTNPPPWNEAAARKIEFMFAEEKAGRPRLIFSNCLPEAHPSWMLVTHNAMEILFTPGRVTMLGESDGNRIRRIYTDGRGHPEVSDPTFHGHSIGHWEGDTLVVDSVGYNEKFWIDRGTHPHTEQLHMVERFTRLDMNTIRYEVLIDDPGAYTAPWSGQFNLRYVPGDELFEYVCQENNFAPQLMVGVLESVDRSSTIVP
jgi:hypothetical protein